MKRLLIPPILIILYIFTINFLLESNVISSSLGGALVPGYGEVLGFGQSISVSVKRPYLFGLIYLPVYIEGLGDVSIYHDVFFIFVFVLAISLIILEFKNRKEIKAGKHKTNKGR
jgi:hypothetical protein